MSVSTATIAESCPPSPPARRSWGKKLLLLLLLTVWTLVFGEIFLRIFNPQPLVPRYVTGGPDGIRANIPEMQFRQWTPEVDVQVRYNDAGMRDDRPAPSLAKPASTCRVALLGDSYFVGFESSWEHSYARQLEQALGERGAHCRVLNFAVSGFGHAEMLVALESRVKPWQPDLVVVSIHQTDGLDNLRSGLFRLDDEGLLHRTGANFLPGVEISDRLNSFALYRWAQENSHLYSAAREWLGRTGKSLLAKLRRGSDEAAGEATGANTAENGEQAKVRAGNRVLNQALAQTLAEQSRAMGADILFVDIPTMGSRIRYNSSTQDLLGDAFPAQFPFVSPLDRFETIMNKNTKIYLERGHRHWTELGNREAAIVTAEAISARKLLPE